MRVLAAALLAGAAATTAAVAPANAQTGDPNQTTTASPPVTVRGPERMVCRAVPRTATRMRTSRVCRTVSQWDEARAGRSQDDELDEAADRLDALGADDISTNCVGDPLNRTSDTPLGPRE